MAKEDKFDKKKILEELEKRITTDLDESFLITDCIGIDLALSGGRGLPLGDWITISSPPATGKTTLLGDMSRRLLNKYNKNGVPLKIVYIDVENSKNLLVDLGLGEHILAGNLIHITGRMTFSQLDVLYDSILNQEGKYKGVKVVIIDSITKVISDINAEDNCEKAEFGNDAKALKKFLKKVTPLHTQKKITTIAICQVGQKQQVMFRGDPRKANATYSIKHDSSIFVKLTKSSDTKKKDIKKIKVQTLDGTQEMTSNFIINISTKSNSSEDERKNRHGRFPDVTVLVDYGTRICNHYSVRLILQANKLIKQVKGGYTLSENFPIAVENSKKVYSLKEIGKFITDNIDALVEFIKQNGMYSPYVGEAKEIENTNEENNEENNEDTYDNSEDNEDE
jgi:RecA/RadA recombinase